MRITGSMSPRRRIASRSSIPLIPGMCTSRIRQSPSPAPPALINASHDANSRASRPSHSSSSLSESRAPPSSSTTKIIGLFLPASRADFRQAASIRLDLDRLDRPIQALDIGAPAQLGSGPQECGRSRRHAEAHGLAQCQPPGETENDARQHAVARADRASRFDRDRGEPLTLLGGYEQCAFLAERQHDDLAAALLDHFACGLLLFTLGADLPTHQIPQLAQTWL